MKITRRKALSAISLISTVGATGGALATALPPENPLERVNRLAWELAEAMDDWMDDISHPDYPKQHWVAVVHPSRTSKFPIAFTSQSVFIGRGES